MPVKVTKVPHEPIVIAEMYGYVNADDALKIYEETARYRGDSQAHFYRITDASQVESSFADIIGILKAVKQGATELAAYDNVTSVFVGSNQWINMAQTGMRLGQFGGVDLPKFDSQEEALDFIRTRIKIESGAS